MNRRAKIMGATLMLAMASVGSTPATAAESSDSTAARIDKALAKATQALLKLQAKDGGWHSETYGVLKPGVATTALVLETLTRLSPATRKPILANLEAAIAFLEKQQGRDGGLGTDGEWLEYPTYATALAVTALMRLDPTKYKDTIRPWVAFLKKAQNSESNGCDPKHVAYGGWQALGQPNPEMVRNADISATRYAMEALEAAGLDKSDPLWIKAKAMLHQCQNWTGQMGEGSDGGFYYSPTNLSLNKPDLKQEKGPGFRSYGTASADGWIAWMVLKDLGVLDERDEKSRLAVEEWFKRSPQGLACPGFENSPGQRSGWDQGLLFYFRASVVTARSRAGALSPQAILKPILDITLNSQGPHGLWKSTSILMKEDDPLIASAFAMQTLIHGGKAPEGPREP